MNFSECSSRKSLNISEISQVFIFGTSRTNPIWFPGGPLCTRVARKLAKCAPEGTGNLDGGCYARIPCVSTEKCFVFRFQRSFREFCQVGEFQNPIWLPAGPLCTRVARKLPKGTPEGTAYLDLGCWAPIPCVSTEKCRFMRFAGSFQEFCLVGEFQNHIWLPRVPLCTRVARKLAKGTPEGTGYLD